MLLIKFLVFLSSLVIPAHAAGTTIYVDQQLTADCVSNNYSIAQRNCTGSDGNAFKKVEGAFTAIRNSYGALDGSTVLVRAGTYKENNEWNSVPQRQSAFIIKNPLTLKAYNKEPVTLTFDPLNPPTWDNNEYGPIISIWTNNVTIEDLTIIGTRSLGESKSGTEAGDTDMNIEVYAKPNVVIRNNRIYDAGHAGVKASSGILIEHNEFANTGFTRRDHGIYLYADSGSPNDTKIIRYNDFHDIVGYGIHLYDYVAYAQVYGNVIHHNAGGGIVLTGDHNQIYNNTIYDNYNGQGLFVFHYGLFNLTIKNNIFWKNAVDIQCDDDSKSPATNSFVSNDYSTVSGTNYKCTVLDMSKNNFSVDPKFVSAAPTTWLDLRLSATSPLIDAGTNVGSPYNIALDPTSTTWPAKLVDQNNYLNWEIGSFAYIPPASPIPTPSPTPSPTPFPIASPSLAPILPCNM